MAAGFRVTALAASGAEERTTQRKLAQPTATETATATTEEAGAVAGEKPPDELFRCSKSSAARSDGYTAEGLQEIPFEKLGGDSEDHTLQGPNAETDLREEFQEMPFEKLGGYSEILTTRGSETETGIREKNREREQRDLMPDEHRNDRLERRSVEQEFQGMLLANRGGDPEVCRLGMPDCALCGRVCAVGVPLAGGFLAKRQKFIVTCSSACFY